MSRMLIERDSLDEKNRLRDESLFHCASGKIGIRGCFEEGAPDGCETIRGAYINGFCETEEITYNEKLYGFPTEKQTIANLPDAQGIEFYADGRKLCCWDKEVSDYRYALDMECGLVKRSFTYRTESGNLQLSFERLTSFERPGLFAIYCKVTSLDFRGQIRIKSILNGNVKNFTSASDPRVAAGSGKMIKVTSAAVDNTSLPSGLNGLLIINAETIKSHRKVEVIAANEIRKQSVKQEIVNHEGEGLLFAESETVLEPGEELTVSKYCFYHEIPDEVSGKDTVIKAYSDGFELIRQEQKTVLDDFWKSSRVVIDSDEVRQEGMDFCIYSMFESAGRDGKSSISAKGLSGEGYEGHYFWDSEAYIFPFFLVTKPEIAKSLLLYRYSKLDKAKEHARILGHNKGALYPWRTIEGSECSSHYPTGSAQYHINGDIARAMIQYWNATEDTSILPQICEVLLETARLWMDLGHYYDETFRIDCVTGPDEYTCMVNNNYYTNAGAANNLRHAARLVRILQATDKAGDFTSRTGVTEEELKTFEEAADKMFYPFSEELGIIEQDDAFLKKKHLDIASIPKENFPMLMHYHPLFINRHQVCKQADAVLAEYLFCKLGSLTSMRTYEYYESVTTHDSSLSKCIFGIVAAKLGNFKEAKDYFTDTLTIDLDDCNGNTRDGLHTANMGGSYRMAVGGFAGLEIDENGLSLFPMLPDGWNEYSFPVAYKRRQIKVSVYKDKAEIHLEGNVTEPISISVFGQEVTVTEKELIVFRKLKGVIFDLDGVVTDTAVYHYKAWKKVADELGIDFDEKKNENFKGVSRATCLELLLQWGNKTMTEEEFADTLKRKNDYYKEMLKDLTPSDILPGVLDSINELHASGIKTALFSVSKNTAEILKRLEISDAFDIIVSGTDIKNSKPHYEGYLLAADRMEIDPRLCAMVEDSVAGITGAKNLAMKTLAIMKENAAGADICIGSTKELYRIKELL